MAFNDDLVDALTHAAQALGVEFRDRLRSGLRAGSFDRAADLERWRRDQALGSWSRPTARIPGFAPWPKSRSPAGTPGQSAIVATIAHELDHEGRAEQHFLPAGPFAIAAVARPLSRRSSGTSATPRRKRCWRATRNRCCASWSCASRMKLGRDILRVAGAIVSAAVPVRPIVRCAAPRIDRRRRASRSSAGGAGAQSRPARRRRAVRTRHRTDAARARSRRSPGAGSLSARPAFRRHLERARHGLR